MTTATIAPDEVKQWLQGLQDRLCAALEAVDGAARFR